MLYFNELSIELNKKCCLNCVHCSSEASVQRSEKLDVDKLKEIISKVRKTHRVDTVSLSGGDPLIYPDFLEIFNFLKQQRVKIIIFSSGTLLDNHDQMSSVPKELLHLLKISKNNPEIHLNIQGYDKNTIETINCVPGSFNFIQQTISNIKQEKLYLGANVVPFKKNFQNLEKIFNFCVEHDFDQIKFLRFVPQGRGKGENLELSPSDFLEVQKSLVKILDRAKSQNEKISIKIGHPINFLFLLGKKDLYPLEDTHCCRGGQDAPLILPDGTVAMCPAWKELPQFSPGNIYTMKFSDIWNSLEFRRFREFVEKGYQELGYPCKDCEFLNECKGKCVAQRLLYSCDDAVDASFADLFRHAPDPLCFKHLIRKVRE